MVSKDSARFARAGGTFPAFGFGGVGFFLQDEFPHQVFLLCGGQMVSNDIIVVTVINFTIYYRLMNVDKHLVRNYRKCIFSLRLRN